jgi:DNA-binding response OmpR family regulator
MKSEQRPPYIGMKAIVVEDDLGTSRLCRRFLMAHGLTVKEVNRGVAALAEARKERPDILFIGLQLRDVSGFEAVSWLKADPVLCLVPIVVLSARTLPMDDHTMRRSGIDAVLRMPISAETFACTLRRVLG